MNEAEFIQKLDRLDKLLETMQDIKNSADMVIMQLENMLAPEGLVGNWCSVYDARDANWTVHDDEVTLIKRTGEAVIVRVWDRFYFGNKVCVFFIKKESSPLSSMIGNHNDDDDDAMLVVDPKMKLVLG